MGINLDAVEAEDHRAALVALLRTLAEQLDTTESAIHAQLAAQYLNAWDKLKALDAGAEPAEVTPLEQIRARRAARGDDAADRLRAPGRRKQGNG